MIWTFLPATELAAHRTAWDALLPAAQPTPFLESAFLLPLLAEFGQGPERLALAHEGGALRAAALLTPAGTGRWTTWQPSQLPLGPWVGAHPAALLPRLLRALPGPVLSLGLTQLDSLCHPAPAEGAALRPQPYIETAWVDVEGTFDAYWAARGKNLRNNTKKQRNKLASEGLTTRLEAVREPSRMAACIAEYGRLESSGWKAGDGTAVHPDNPQGRFYTAMLEAFGAQGRALVLRYCFDEAVVAMDLCIERGAHIVILKTTYDEQHKSVSPATLMRQEAFQAWFDEARYQRIEFYGKVMEWHTRWTPNARPLYHLTQYRWPVLRRLHEWRRAGAEATAPSAPEAP